MDKEGEFNKISKEDLENALKPDANPKLIERYGGYLPEEELYFSIYKTYRLPSGESIFTAKGKKEWEKG
jgi:hypothetical protein